MYPRLTRAPVREAVIDVRASFEKPPPSASYKKFQEALSGQFPKAAPLQHVQLSYNLDSRESSQKHIELGMRLDNPETAEVVQAKPEGIIYSKLAPYDTWDTLVRSAREVAEVYWEIFSPRQVARISTRFINVISLPEGPIDFDEYLVFGPQLPKGLPQTVSEFQNRIVSPQPDGKTLLVISTRFPGPEVGSGISVVLDIDAVRNAVFRDLASAFESLGELRSLKNAAFFNSITDCTREQLNG
ncbi:TIGR04255 family protein [Thioalkalivibrio sp. XN8]|uniref:TIGR04255 family protein n=1 Tax=Thioalkalivibrio sp. XN8 TaxID=2712863 RepID=UPI001F0D4ACB|nr:TIGR04255 family protein [Thioalkalivibrio sp. XN8]